jgi:hypothetical protein
VSDDRTLSRIAKLLRQAEGTDNENEATAFMEAAQRLATLHSIDLAVARARTATSERREQPIARRIAIGERGKRGLRTYTSLFLAVGHANGIQFDIAQNSSYVVAYGFPSDIVATQAIYASLAVQMAKASDTYVRFGDYKTEEVYRPVRKPTRRGRTRTEWEFAPISGSTARINFQQAYSERIGQRLAAARKAAEDSAITEDAAVLAQVADPAEPSAPSTELVLRAKQIEVRDFRNARSTARGSWRGGRAASGYSERSQLAGQQAADRARLGTEAQIGGSQRALPGGASW